VQFDAFASQLAPYALGGIEAPQPDRAVPQHYGMHVVVEGTSIGWRSDASYTNWMAAIELKIDADERHAASSDAEFTLAHLSDLHLSSLEGVRPGALLGKRMLGYASWWFRRRHEHRIDVLDALRTDLHAEHPDHIAVTGDLTHLGLPQEFRDACSWLERLGKPDTITVVPGNHDAYAREPWQETFAQWSAYMQGDDARAGAEFEEAFPSLRLRRHVALIGLSTAQPSAPFLATGHLGERQLQRLARMLEQTSGAGLFRIVILHHPPAAHTVRWRKSLRDGAALRDILKRHEVELVLHGHAHFSAAAYLDPRLGRNLAIGVPSASAIGKKVDRHATYHVYRIARGDRGWRLRVSVRAFSPDLGRFVPEDGRRLRLALTAAPAAGRA
jgi:3',5'-cyclic AMP phosphodiesterase CpdA